MLDSYFEINFPYGMKKNSSGEWMLFNRENSPLGLKPGVRTGWEEYPLLYNKFYGITERFLTKLVGGNKKQLMRNEEGKIQTVYFYTSYNDPFRNEMCTLKYWRGYMYILQQLGALKYRVK